MRTQIPKSELTNNFKGVNNKMWKVLWYPEGQGEVHFKNWEGVGAGNKKRFTKPYKDYSGETTLDPGLFMMAT